MPNAGGAGEKTRRNQAGRRLAAGVLALALISALGRMPTGCFAVRPGPVRSLRGVVDVGGLPPPEVSFHMVSVVAEEATVYSLVKAVLDPAQVVFTKRDVYGARSPEQFRLENEELMAKSQMNAAYLAFRESGFSLDRRDPMPLDVTVKSGAVLGPSAGLAFALEMISTLRGEDLTAGRKVAATGVLDSEGSVMPVGGVAQKVVACRLAGMELFLVPAQDATEAARSAGELRVVGVRSLAEALACLRGARRNQGPAVP